MPQKNNSPKQPSVARKRVTVRDIAKEMGIHFTTVAEALRGSTRIKESTRLEVKAVADRMGYSPDPLLSALSSYRSSQLRGAFQGVIAWINGFSSRDKMTERSTFYGDAYWGAGERAKMLGYKMEEFVLGDEKITGDRLSQILNNRNITGVIVGPLPEMTDQLYLDWKNFVSVRIGYSYENPDITTVVPDQFLNTQWIFEELINKGFRRIGFACPRFLDDRVSNKFSAGYLSLAYRYLGELTVPLYLDDQPEGSYEPFIEWYQAHKPEAIIMGGRSVFYRMLLEAGVRVPEDVQCLAMHAEYLKTPLAGVSQNGEVVGATAVDHVVSMIHGFKRGLEPHPKTMMIKGRWIDGETYNPELIN